MTHDILIRQNMLFIVDRSPGDVTALPDDSSLGFVGASLIAEADWISLVDEYGSEEALMKELGVEKDLRQDGEWRYVPPIIAEAERGEY